MKGYAVAGRYARALFEIGADGGDDVLTGLDEALRALAGADTTSPELAAMLRSPVITGREKQKVLEHLLAASLPELAPAVGQVVGNFCGLLAEKHRLPLLGLIARAFTALLDARRDITRGRLCTAVKLDKKRRTAITSRLEKAIGGTLKLEYLVDPAILGGITIRLGDRMLDASLRTQLDMLRDTIKKGE